MVITHYFRARGALAIVVALLFAFAVPPLAYAQEKPASTAAETPATPEPPPKPAAIPLSEIAARAESMSAQLRDITADVATDQITRTIAAQLPTLTREIDARLQEGVKILAQRPSLEILSGLERGWFRHYETLSEWNRDVTRRVTELERTLAKLSESAGIWQETLVAAKAAEAPGEVLRKAEGLLTAINKTRDAVESQNAQVLGMQSRVVMQQTRVSDAIAAVTRARDELVDRIFVKDSPAIWTGGLVSRAAESVAQDSQQSMSAQAITLQAYAERESDRFLLHGLIIALLAGGFYALRRHIRRTGQADAAMQRCGEVFAMPVATALVLTVFASRWIYPQAPRLLWALLGAAALIPTILILRRLIARELVPVLYAVVGFFFLDQVRALVASLQVVPRLYFLVEMLAGVAFLSWYLLTLRKSRNAAPERAHFRKTVRVAAYITLLFFAGTGLANALGYVNLANLVGNAILGSSYYGLILYAVVTIVDALVMLALQARPLNLLGMVSRHAELLRRRIRLVLQWAAFAMWVLFFLQRLALRERVITQVKDIVFYEVSYGSISISLGDVLAFGFTIWASFLASRFLRFLLNEEIYPHARLKRGLPYAISQTLHYVILVTGFLVAVAALGFDMTKFTILAGAFTVGVGFGLQNIFNNFVSGLILLFERPVQVGDMIQMDDASGVVERIGIRASIVRTSNGSEIIVPNGRFISERLVNWTFSDRRHGLTIPVAAANGANVKQVIEILQRVAAAHPHIKKEPAPLALLERLGPDWLGFELRAWTDHIEEWEQTRSELAIAIADALRAENIALK